MYRKNEKIRQINISVRVKETIRLNKRETEKWSNCNRRQIVRTTGKKERDRDR
jgi:hypothetical protein